MSNQRIVLPASIRAEIRRQAEEVPAVLTAEDRDEYLKTVEPEHSFAVEQALCDQMEIQEKAIWEWRDRMLMRLLTVSESLLDRGKDVRGDAPQTPSVDGWVDSETAARHIGLTAKSTREGAARGRLPGHKYPANSRRGVWRFKIDELDQWLSKKASRSPRMKGQSVW